MYKSGLIVLLLTSTAAFGHAGKTAAIDDFCLSVRHEFVEAAPRFFSGPEPWVELDRRPDAFADVALASVYSEGFRVIWVVLEMSGPGDSWYETTHYFFNDAGEIRKRERYLENTQANVLVEEATYFEKGKSIKSRYHHAALAKGKENWDDFYDPNAPEYKSTAELPVSFVPGEFRQLADAMDCSGLRTECTNSVTKRP